MNKLSKHSNRKLGFSLIELLISLLIFSLILHGISISFTNYQQIDSLIRNDKNGEWHLFLTILEKELSVYEIYSVAPKIIYLRDKADQKSYQIVLQQNKIYKTPGHHPYLYDVKDWSLSYENDLLIIQLQFLNDQIFMSPVIIETNNDSRVRQ